MSGVAIINYMLSNDGALISIVSDDKIISGGIIPIGTQYPAISIKQISGFEYKTINRSGTQLVTERVQVTVKSSYYHQKKEILDLIREALHSVRGMVGLYYVDSITPDIDGPDFDYESPVTFEQSIDYIVRFNR